MIPKGNQRAGGQQLATHLMNAFDNDRVEIAEVRGAVAQDLHGAFAEWYAQSKATDCLKYLYSLSINPDHRQKSYTRADYYDFIARAEKKLRLAGQPRAVVFHVKYGREHCHVVWSRIDGYKGKAVQMSHDHQKLRKIAQEYARDHHLTLPPGMRNDRGAARFAFKAAAENLAEKQQQERSGISKQERRDQITKIWNDSSDAKSLIRNLEAAGYLLARGDQRKYVVVDLSGEVHSLSRQLIDVKKKELNAKLSALDINTMPFVLDAQTFLADKREVMRDQKEEQDKSAFLKHEAQAKTEAQRRRDELAKAQADRRAPLEEKKQQLALKHEAESKALADLHTAKTASIANDRAASQPKGVLSFLARITGYNAVTAWQRQRQDRKMGDEFKLQKEALARRHEREMEDFRHRERGLMALDKRERRSLETILRRDAFNSLAAAPQKEQPRVANLSAAFTQAAAPRQEQPAGNVLTASFNDAVQNKMKTNKQSPEADITDAQRRALELKKAFNRRAGRREKESEKDRDDRHYRRTPPDFSIRR